MSKLTNLILGEMQMLSCYNPNYFANPQIYDIIPLRVNSSSWKVCTWTCDKFDFYISKKTHNYFSHIQSYNWFGDSRENLHFMKWNKTNRKKMSFLIHTSSSRKTIFDNIERTSRRGSPKTASKCRQQTFVGLKFWMAQQLHSVHQGSVLIWTTRAGRKSTTFQC